MRNNIGFLLGGIAVGGALKYGTSKLQKKLLKDKSGLHEKSPEELQEEYADEADEGDLDEIEQDS